MSDDATVFVGDEAQRMVRLMERVASDGPMWTALYRDEAGVLWKESFPWSERHGGGPAQLEKIDRRQALLEFDVTEEDLGGEPMIPEPLIPEPTDTDTDTPGR
ncbi:MAG: Imm27 family immunity protein [Acidimicrobiia bacterium]